MALTSGCNTRIAFTLSRLQKNSGPAAVAREVDTERHGLAHAAFTLIQMRLRELGSSSSEKDHASPQS